MKYGIRDICDVVFKAKKAGKIGNYAYTVGQPVLYIDSAKTSVIEGTATTSYATGGRGNSRLIAWEGEKTLTFTVEDALLSDQGMAILTGAKLFKTTRESASSAYVHQFARVDFEVSALADSEDADVQFDPVPAQQFLSQLEKHDISNIYVNQNSEDTVEISFTAGDRQEPIILWERKDSEMYRGHLSFLESSAEIYDTWEIILNYLDDSGEVQTTTIDLTDEIVNQGISMSFDVTKITLVETSLTGKTFKGYIRLGKEKKIQDVTLTYALKNAPGLRDIDISKKNPIFIMSMRNGNFGKKLEGTISIQNDILSFTTSSIFFYKGLTKDEIVPAVIDYYAIKSELQELIIDAKNFADNYYVEAKTTFKRQHDGKEVDAILTFPNAKVQSNFTFNMAASGDPSTFNFVMDAMPGTTINNSSKNVLCEMLIVGSKEQDVEITQEDSVATVIDSRVQIKAGNEFPFNSKILISCPNNHSTLISLPLRDSNLNSLGDLYLRVQYGVISEAYIKLAEKTYSADSLYVEDTTNGASIFRLGRHFTGEFAEDHINISSEAIIQSVAAETCLLYKIVD